MNVKLNLLIVLVIVGSLVAGATFKTLVPTNDPADSYAHSPWALASL